MVDTREPPKASSDSLASPAPADKPNTLAVLSLVFGFLGGIAAIPLGHIARSQIRRTGERGGRMAFWGLILGYGWIGMTVVAVVAFGYFGIHTAFVDKKVDEANPFAIEVVGTVDDDDGPGIDDAAGEPDGEAADETGNGDGAEMPDAAGAPDGEAVEPRVETLASGDFISRGRYSTDGQAIVLTDGNDRYLRFEDFSTSRGPDLFVYLVPVPEDAPQSQFDDDFVDLGTLRGNIGDQNYEIPDDVDLDRYNTVVIWCKRFTSAFGAATMS